MNRFENRTWVAENCSSRIVGRGKKEGAKLLGVTFNGSTATGTKGDTYVCRVARGTTNFSWVKRFARARPWRMP